MVQKVFPLSQSPISTVEDWSKIAGSWAATGVIRSILNELQVYADSTGMQVKVKSGAAFIKGIYFEETDETILPIGAANTNPRIDRVVVRLDFATEVAQFAILQGVAAVTPIAPEPTQNSNRWEIPLAQITVDANAVTIASSKVSDDRSHTGTENPYFVLKRNTIAVSSANTLTQIPFDASNVTNYSNFTIGANEMIFKENGMYLVQIKCDASGVSTDQTGEVIIRRYVSSIYGDFSSIYRGATGQGGNNGGIPISHTIILPCLAGGKLQFFTRFSEAPRTVLSAYINVWKIANL